uniref:Uncharacterized protein n=1 Tax=Triticum urartu TaxID=4572 RepID=A0A8R7UJF2_TRIUA
MRGSGAEAGGTIPTMTELPRATMTSPTHSLRRDEEGEASGMIDLLRERA